MLDTLSILCLQLRYLLNWLRRLWAGHRNLQRWSRYRRQNVDKAPTGWRSRPKPKWVPERVLRLKALMPFNSCRKIAATFNVMYFWRNESVGKSYVANVLKREGHRLAQIRRGIRRRKPRPMPPNKIWALDLTYLPGDPKPILGVIDHGTRACLRTPAMAWHGKAPRPQGKPRFFEAWEGILAGFYFPS